MTANRPAAKPLPIQTRKLSGKPAWPTMLLAGVEGSGKTVRALQAATSPMIHRTFLIVCGEDDPDDYGADLGAFQGIGEHVELVEHDGTYRGILGAATAAASQVPGDDERPNLIVLDSGSRFWNLLADLATETHMQRVRKRNGGRLPDDFDPATAKLTPDLWNNARDRWYHLLDTLRYRHQGPAIITSRLKMTTIFDGEGNPTKQKDWDQKAQFDLPYDVGMYVQMRAPYPQQDDVVYRVKSARYEHPTDARGKPKAMPLADDWSVEGMWQQMGLTAETVAPVQAHHQIQESGSFDTEDDRRGVLLNEVLQAAQACGASPQRINTEWAQQHNGQAIQETTDFGGLELLRDDLKAQAGQTDQPPEAPSDGGASAAQKLRDAAERAHQTGDAA